MVDWSNPVGRCPRCLNGIATTDAESGEAFCSGCGLVLAERIVARDSEMRLPAHEGKQDNSRTGSPTTVTMHDMGLYTIIGRADKDASGKPLSTPMKGAIKRLRTWDARSQTQKYESIALQRALIEMNGLKDKLVVSDAVFERAAYLFRKAYDMGMARGHTLGVIVTSAMYAACKESCTIRNLKDVARASNMKRREVSKNYRRIVVEMGLKIPVTNPVKYVSRIASRLGLPEATSRQAIATLNKAREKGDLSGKNPMGLAAAALYMSCAKTNNRRTLCGMADASGISNVSVRHSVQFLTGLLCTDSAAA